MQVAGLLTICPSRRSFGSSAERATFVNGERRRSFGTTARTAISALNPMDKLPAGVNPDEYVPPYYIERKRQRDSIEDRKEQEGGLMHELNAGILSDEVAATTRRLVHKIPTEHEFEGILMHPSGFVVPQPGEAPELASELRERDMALQTAAVAARVHEDASLRELTGVHVRAHDHKVPYEIMANDGTVQHPSGFVPPTAAHEFSSAPNEDWTEGQDVTLRLTSGPAARTPWKQA